MELFSYGYWMLILNARAMRHRRRQLSPLSHKCWILTHTFEVERLVCPPPPTTEQKKKHLTFFISLPTSKKRREQRLKAISYIAPFANTSHMEHSGLWSALMSTASTQIKFPPIHWDPNNKHMYLLIEGRYVPCEIIPSPTEQKGNTLVEFPLVIMISIKNPGWGMRIPSCNP